jgi:hypothetical protein
MAERDPVDLIKDQLNQWEGLAGLYPDHQLFKQWQSETLTILEKIFSPKSTHCQNLLALRFREVTVKTFASPEIDKINSMRYKRDLESAKVILQSAIKELTLDRTLFKKIQTTPKTVEVSLKGEYFISSGITDPEMKKAIQSAFDGSGFKPIQGAESLHGQIERIRRARFGIYDFSKPEVNEAFLELGIALGMGKEVTILYKKSSRLPETIRKLNGIEYESFSELTEKLRKRMA